MKFMDKCDTQGQGNIISENCKRPFYQSMIKSGHQDDIV